MNKEKNNKFVLFLNYLSVLLILIILYFYLKDGAVYSANGPMLTRNESPVGYWLVVIFFIYLIYYHISCILKFKQKTVDPDEGNRPDNTL